MKANKAAINLLTTQLASLIMLTGNLTATQPYTSALIPVFLRGHYRSADLRDVICQGPMP